MCKGAAVQAFPFLWVIVPKVVLDTLDDGIINFVSMPKTCFFFIFFQILMPKPSLLFKDQIIDRPRTAFKGLPMGFTVNTAH